MLGSFLRVARLRLLLLVSIAALGLTACGGGSSAPGGTPGAGPGAGAGGGSMTLTVDTSGLQTRDGGDVLAQSSSSSSSLQVFNVVVKVQDPSTLRDVHPVTEFQTSSSDSTTTVTIQNIVPGTWLVTLQVFDEFGNLVFEGEELASVNVGQVTLVVFDGHGGGGGGGGGGVAGPAFRAVIVDEEQFDPDVSMADNGLFVIVAAISDLSDEDGDTITDTYVHGERFNANFTNGLASSLDPDTFDIGQYFSAVSMNPIFTFLHAQNPAVSMNDEGAFSTVWRDRDTPNNLDIIRGVILGAGLVPPSGQEPDMVVNLASNSNQLAFPDVSMTNRTSPANIDVCWLNLGDGEVITKRFNDGDVSGSVPQFGAPFVDPALPSASDSVTVSPPVPPAIANRKDLSQGSEVVTVFADPMIPEVTAVIRDFGGLTITVDVNDGQPSHGDPMVDIDDRVQGVAVDMFDDGTFVVVYAVYDNSETRTKVYARCFTIDGTPVGGEFLIEDPGNLNSSTQPDVAVVENDGTFLVVWTRFDNVGNDVFLQRFDCFGAAYTLDPINVSAGQALATPGTNAAPAVAADSVGNGVVTWTSGDTPTRAVLARLFGALTTRVNL